MEILFCTLVFAVWVYVHFRSPVDTCGSFTLYENLGRSISFNAFELCIYTYFQNQIVFYYMNNINRIILKQ